MAGRYDRLPFERVIQSSSPVGGKGGEAKRIDRSVGRSVGRSIGWSVACAFCSPSIARYTSSGAASVEQSSSALRAAPVVPFTLAPAALEQAGLLGVSLRTGLCLQSRIGTCTGVACDLLLPFALLRVPCSAVGLSGRHSLGVHASVGRPGRVLSTWRWI